MTTDLPAGGSSPPATSPAALSPAAYIAQARFRRSLTLPPTDTHGALTVTYAVSGDARDDAPTMLFVGGMYGGRFLALLADYLGQQLGVRIVSTDRPGMGGSTPVAAALRLPVWLETVPALLRALNVPHVGVLAHSCGALYALNAVHAYPEMLPPARPALYLLAPWVPPSRSGAKLMVAAGKLPAAMVGRVDSVMTMINGAVVAPLSFSSTVVTAVSVAMGRGRGAAQGEEEERCRRFCGMTAGQWEARSREAMRVMFKETTEGANGEALLCLQKPAAGSWGVCEDYTACAAALEERMAEYFKDQHGEHRFVLHAYWATEDIMIGAGGQQHFDRCFNEYAETDGASPKTLVYKTTKTEDTNHETICSPQSGVLAEVLEDFVKVDNDRIMDR